MTEPASTWAALEANGDGSGVLLRRVATEPPSDVHLGLRMPERHPLLVVRVDGPVDEAGMRFESHGLRCDVDQGQVAGRRDTAIVIELLDPAHVDVFGVLVSDLAGRVGEGLDDATAVSVLTNRLGRWEQLLRRKRDGLSIEKQRGLYGELLALNTLLDAGMTPEVALAGWSGPGGGTRDWVLPELNVEVKTRASTKRSVRISSEFQLDDAGSSRVILMVLTVDQAADGGRTLNQLVAETAERTRPSEDAFQQRISEYGWYERHRDRYEGTAWAVRDDAAYDVASSGFPRIVRSELADGLSGVTYDLAVGALSSSRIPADEFRGLIERSADES